MLTIGELAAAAGTTARTVRHYHSVGLLPQPERRPNGYRAYDVAALVRLVRVRRLVGLGLSLPEVRDALAGDDDRGLRELLGELVTDLGHREAELRKQRRRLEALLAAGTDLLVPDTLGALVRELRALPVEPHLVAREEQVLELLEATLSPRTATAVREAYAATLADPDRVARGVALTRRFDALATADPDDPEVAALAVELAEAGRELVPAAADGVASQDGDAAVWAALAETMSPAQQRCMTLAQPEGGA